jgi:PilZ domain
MVDANPTPVHKGTPNPRSANRRVAERSAIRIEAICEFTEASGAPSYCTVLVISLSTHGAGCVTPCFVERGKTVRLELTNAAKTVWHTRTARVVHARPVGAGNTIIGCEFLDTLGKEEFQSLVE